MKPTYTVYTNVKMTKGKEHLNNIDEVNEWCDKVYGKPSHIVIVNDQTGTQKIMVDDGEKWVVSKTVKKESNISESILDELVENIDRDILEEGFIEDLKNYMKDRAHILSRQTIQKGRQLIDKNKETLEFNKALGYIVDTKGEFEKIYMDDATYAYALNMAKNGHIDRYTALGRTKDGIGFEIQLRKPDFWGKKEGDREFTTKHWGSTNESITESIDNFPLISSIGMFKLLGEHIGIDVKDELSLRKVMDYYCEAEENQNGLMSIIKKAVKFVKLPSFNADSLKKWLSDNADEFIKANQLYAKAMTMRESTLNEGFFDSLKGINKNTLIMFILIALSALSGNSHADIGDLESAAASIVKEMSVVRVDQSDSRSGFVTDYYETGKQSQHYKQVLNKVDRDTVQKFIKLAADQGYDESSAINILTYMLEQNIVDSHNAKQKLDGLSAKEFDMLARASFHSATK